MRSVARHLLKTLALALGLLVLVSGLVFWLEDLIPGDAARSLLGAAASQEQYEQLRAQLGLDQPLFARFVDYWAGLFQGDMGQTLATLQPVVDIILQRLPITLSLVVLGTIVIVVVGILLGVFGARKGVLGGAVDVVSLAGMALPNFWLAIMLVSLFAIRIPLFPATGYVRFEDDPAGWFASLVLPVIALSLGGIAIVAKSTRDGVLDGLSQNWVRTLRSCGVSETSIVWRHALRGAALRIFSVANIAFIGSLGGAVMVENAFALNGLGSLMVSSVTGHEIYVVVGIVLVFTVFVVVANIITDALQLGFDPRARRKAAR